VVVVTSEEDNEELVLVSEAEDIECLSWVIESTKSPIAGLIVVAAIDRGGGGEFEGGDGSREGIRSMVTRKH